MNIPTLKSALRRDAVARVLSLAEADRADQESALRARFDELPGLRDARTVLLYVRAFPEEIDTAPMIAAVLARGQRLLCPRVDRKSRRLILHAVADPATDLVPGTLGIPEPRRDAPEVDPAEVDWVLVPGLLFDPRGYRLGRGAGHYDRLLPTFRPDVPRWAFCLDCQWEEALPAEPHDVPLDGVVSPSREYRRPD